MSLEKLAQSSCREYSFGPHHRNVLLIKIGGSDWFRLKESLCSGLSKKPAVLLVLMSPSPCRAFDSTKRRLQLWGRPSGAPHWEEIAGQFEALWGAEPHRLGSPPPWGEEEDTWHRGPKASGGLPNQGVSEGSNACLSLLEPEPKGKASDERHRRLIGATAGPRRRVSPESNYHCCQRWCCQGRHRKKRRFTVSSTWGLALFCSSCSFLPQLPKCFIPVNRLHGCSSWLRLGKRKKMKCCFVLATVFPFVENDCPCYLFLGLKTTVRVLVHKT